MKRKVIRVPVPWYEYLPAVVMNLNPSLKANFMTKKSTFTFYSVMKICNYNVPLKFHPRFSWKNSTLENQVSYYYQSCVRSESLGYFLLEGRDRKMEQVL